MCNEYQQRVKRGEYADAFSQLQVPFHWADPEPNRTPDDPVRPTNRAAMIRPVDPANPRGGLVGVERRWWLVPFFHKGPVSGWKSMCTNARIETVDTTPAFRDAYRHRRALIPTSSFIEYDEPPGWRKGQPKRRWEVTWQPADQLDRVRYFAGIWDRATPSDIEGPLESFAFITGPPGPDVAKAHDRQPVLMTLEQGLTWLDLDGPGKSALVTETPAGTYQLTERPRDLSMSAEMRKALP
jgi:putative SOS response-associated peptidase YedK